MPTEQAKMAPDHSIRETSADRRRGWPVLPWSDRITLTLTLVLVACITVPGLPPGICFGDAGELQLASTVLGITHAPGYPGYIFLGYLATLVPGVDPAYIVSLACLLSGLVMVGLCILIQIRLGVSTYVACAVGLIFIANRRVWINLVGPEVYAPTLAFVGAAIYFLIQYARVGTRRSLYVAAFLFGFALANRPPVLFAAPFFIGAWWLAKTRWDTSRKDSGRAFAILTCWAIAPMLFSLGYLYVRDTPQTLYNYINNNNAEFHVLPDSTDGVGAKIERVLYHTTAREFTYAMGNTWRGVWKKLIWLRKEFFLYQPITLGLALLVIGIGAVFAYRDCPAAFWALIGLLISCLIFICSYAMWGQAADYLPLVWTACIFGGVSASPILPFNAKGGRKVIAAAFLAVMILLTIFDTEQRSTLRQTGDATGYVAALDLASMPEDAVICVEWPRIPPLMYAHRVLTRRNDIKVIAAQNKNWAVMLEPLHDRPVFVTKKSWHLSGYSLTPYRYISAPIRNADANGQKERLVPIVWQLTAEPAGDVPGTGGS